MIFFVEAPNISDDNTISGSESEESFEEEAPTSKAGFFRLQLPFRKHADPNLPRARWSAGKFLLMDLSDNILIIKTTFRLVIKRIKYRHVQFSRNELSPHHYWPTQ